MPTLPEVIGAIDKNGLFTTDIEILRLHYAETLRQWILRMQQHREEIIRLFGDVLYRKWEFYFVGSELGFRRGDLMVFQIQLSKRLETVPLTRDYMFEWEQKHAGKAVQSRRSLS